MDPTIKPPTHASTPATPQADDWVARSLRAVWHPCTQMKHHERLPLLPIARGQG
ncbi:MAG TPA: adenosylmethionine--8-amino-7-oxononanoate aminotransferase BioA, partial [Paraburkholderia sp.]